MKNDPITLRLASLSEHDRFLAQAQMARAEAIVVCNALRGALPARLADA